jgi:hypothetical protein
LNQAITTFEDLDGNIKLGLLAKSHFVEDFHDTSTESEMTTNSNRVQYGECVMMPHGDKWKVPVHVGQDGYLHQAFMSILLLVDALVNVDVDIEMAKSDFLQFIYHLVNMTPEDIVARDQAIHERYVTMGKLGGAVGSPTLKAKLVDELGE